MSRLSQKYLLQWLVVLGAVATFTWVFSVHVSTGDQRRVTALAIDERMQAELTSGIAPDFEAIRADGSKIRLSDLRGRVVFVNFWATWCKPCEAEIPDLEKLKDKMKHVPFEILAISSDSSWDDINAFFNGRETPMLVALDPGGQSIANLYGSEKLPETFVVDREGQLRLRFVSVQPWTDEKIHRYLEWLATN